MNKNDTGSRKWNISDMAAHLPHSLIEDVEPMGDIPSPSPQRIAQLALQKRQQYLNENEEKPMKKMITRTLLVAAIICATSITVFAATGGFDYIKRIFGDSARSIQHEIVTPGISASANGRELALEAAVTDGYVTNMVVSLTGAEPSVDRLFDLSGDVEMYTYGYQTMDDLSTADKSYYVVNFTNQRRFESADVTLSLNQSVAPIDLSFQIDNHMGNALVTFPADAMSDEVHLKELQISPMGFMLIGAEDEAKRGLPVTIVTVVFSDGNLETLEAEFDDGDETITGGGGAIIVESWQEAPLVTSFQGTRNPDGEVVVTGQFSRIINPDQIEKVIIQGREYPVT